MKMQYAAAALGLGALILVPIGAREPLAARIAHSDPSRYRPSRAVHGGAGSVDFTALFDAHTIEPNLQFLHRGVIEPKSGIGAHFHNQCEEMFVILDGEAEFTIDGHTSLLKGPAGAPCKLGHSHAIYNATDKPVQWLNINVSMAKDQYDNFDLGDTRVGAALDPIPQFITHAARPRAAAPLGGDARRERNGAVPPCTRSDDFHQPLGIRRSFGPDARSFGWSAHAP